MKNMFYELPVIHVGAGIHTEAVESSLRSQACPSRSSPALRPMNAAQVAEELRGGSLVLDTRPAHQFASLHIRGSIKISHAGNFVSWAAIIIDRAQKLILIAEDTKRAQEAYNRLVRVGLAHVIEYSLVDEQHWRDAGLELASISIERCEQIQRTLQSDPSLQLIDVRSRAE
jgi:rhodanese-related sulfurtransferase